MTTPIKPKRIVHCSICHRPNITKRTCKHCYDDQYCYEPKCERCKKAGKKLAKIIGQFECPACGISLTKYDSGEYKAFAGYYTDDIDDEILPEHKPSSIIERHRKCLRCKSLGIDTSIVVCD